MKIGLEQTLSSHMPIEAPERNMLKEINALSEVVRIQYASSARDRCIICPCLDGVDHGAYTLPRSIVLLEFRRVVVIHYV